MNASRKLHPAAVLPLLLITALAAGCGGPEEEPVAGPDDAIESETAVVEPAAPAREIVSYRCSDEELIEALKSRKPATVKACLDAGTSPDAIDEDERTALYLAASKGDTESVRALLEAGAWADRIEDPEGVTPLFAAALRGHAEIVDLLLDHGADANFRTATNSPLLAACRKKHTRIALRLIDAGADVNFQGGSAGIETPLVRAALSGDQVLLERLIASGADVASQGGKVLRLIQGKKSRQEMYDFLVAAGATLED